MFATMRQSDELRAQKMTGAKRETSTESSQRFGDSAPSLAARFGQVSRVRQSIKYRSKRYVRMRQLMVGDNEVYSAVYCIVSESETYVNAFLNQTQVYRVSPASDFRKCRTSNRASLTSVYT